MKLKKWLLAAWVFILVLFTVLTFSCKTIKVINEQVLKPLVEGESDIQTINENRERLLIKRFSLDIRKGIEIQGTYCIDRKGCLTFTAWKKVTVGLTGKIGDILAGLIDGECSIEINGKARRVAILGAMVQFKRTTLTVSGKWCELENNQCFDFKVSRNLLNDIISIVLRLIAGRLLF